MLDFDLSVQAMAVVLATVGIVSYVLYISLRYITASPLRTVPGPSLANFSILWQLKHTLTGIVGVSIRDAHRKYGRVVRIGHNEVSICGPEAVKTVLLKPYDKGDWYKIFAVPDSSWPNVMNTTSHEAHKTLQRKLAKGYNLSSFIEKEPKIDELIAQFQFSVEEVMKQENQVELGKWFSFFSFDIVGLVTFSRCFGFLEEKIDIGKCIATSHTLVPYLAIMAYFHKWHDAIMSNAFVKWIDFQPMEHIMNTCEAAVTKREQSSDKKQQHDMIDCWINQDQGEPLTQREVLASANANIAAGTDTVVTALQAFVYVMLRHPRCLKLLQKELDEAAQAGLISSPVQYHAAQQLPYFQACLKELHRYHPTPTTSSPRLVPAGGITVEGHYIPEGHLISINAWAIHYDTDIFGTDADEFKPERWLGSRGKALEKYLITFSAGHGFCPGKPLAHLQMSKTLPTMFLDYDMELTHPEREWKIAKPYLVAQSYDWTVQLRRRRQQEGVKVE